MSAAKITTVGLNVHLRGTSGDGAPDSSQPSYVVNINGDGSVDAHNWSGTNIKTGLQYVEIGGTPPTRGVDQVNYFQETISAS